MTKLILDPLSLPFEFPKASVSNTFRVRLLAQVIKYVDKESSLIISKIANIPKLHEQIDLTSQSETQPETFTVNIHNLLPNIDPEMTYPGTLVNLVGYWDGEELCTIECYLINGQSMIPADNIETLINLNKLKDFD